MRPLVKTAIETAGDWGAPPVDPAVAATPTTPEAAATTQATQTANEQERVAIASAQLQPPPFGVPMVGDDGRVSQTWLSWITKLYQRSGGATVTSASDMDILTEFDDLSAMLGGGAVIEWSEQMPRPDSEGTGSLLDLPLEARVVALAQQVEALAGMVLGIPERGWNRQAAMTADAGAAPVGGTGATAGAWDTAAHRDAAIATINNLRTRLIEVEIALKAVRIL